jgi:hypothetical protein
MDSVAPTDLEMLARAVGRAVAGPDAIDFVRVEPAMTALDTPAYDFWFRIDRAQPTLRVGLLMARLGELLRDELLSRGDTSFPMVWLTNDSLSHLPEHA